MEVSKLYLEIWRKGWRKKKKEILVNVLWSHVILETSVQVHPSADGWKS